MSNTNNNSGLSQNILNKLAHILPATKQGVTGQVIEFIIEQTLFELGQNKTLKEISAGIGSIFLLKFSSEEVSEILEKLQEKNHIIKSSSHKYSLRDVYVSKFKELHQNIELTEQKIFSEWAGYIKSKYSKLSKEEILSLEKDLHFYINRMFCKHGAECAVLLYPDNQKINNLINKYSEGKINKYLPPRTNYVMSVRRTEFPLFFKNSNIEKRRYFTGMLDGTFIYNLIQIDPHTKKYLKENFRNYKFYLDTNILYSLFDLTDPKGKNVVENVLKKCEHFGIKLAVTEKTITEMKLSIKTKSRELLNSKPIKRELAGAAADLVSEDSFIAAYWRLFHKTGIKKQDFIQKFNYIEELLKARGIEIEYQYHKFLEEEILEEIKILQNTSAGNKAEVVAEHDVFYRLLIRYLRDKAKYEKSDKRYWFLTFDSQLLPYSLETRNEHESPFIIFPHQIFQILRPFTERTDNFDQTFIELFSRPHIKSSEGILPHDIAERILSTISSYKDLPTNVAIDIIMDANFQEAILSEESKKIQLETIEEHIDNAMSHKVKKLEQKIMDLEASLKKKELLRRGKGENKHVKNDKRGKEFEKKHNQLIEKSKELSKKRKELNKKNQELQKHREWFTEKDKENKKLRMFLFFISLLFLIVTNVFLFYYFWMKISAVIKELWVATDIILIIFILKIKWRLSLSIQIVLGLLALLQFIPWLISFLPK
ncbi:hypothetical protein A2331_06805 [Candidatus Falkowbacteria bacterium RIFOXYB2_FULL_34_18]|uniref:Uncharacterized protein n=1 Tax=Candidatus Falkowbacteria bacterium RIFOXYD2_FULL_34_120 TaxID=1798007 RepID=A0A1F5TSF7_9BACT|nr:MAG: hypothetical protein A2331_06805 [Candidatus Falkowbacteria bacterium RIFOXYB2_FULL_34_18]OGF29970.1 MAG: hypothetical protein A2500_03875 [Candidatus Falkowbacteria bacterium RIFOXYC12_FULL_34_55]OGF37173.1 MAG: hypothetical protein A2466_02645 [Candidatus Falkowbacteria bacterium RIFOXYC2_FULL_34_220]OGF39506.1 MAG: hypothetical protein A2515_04240 [Candidatus Falkowbacteria bacterium RIFOXYD12_FULL_34_57]OGF41511.1 MAG: hypothetical protein A2531_02360 [Candidatus Falkowbacteria bact